MSKMLFTGSLLLTLADCSPPDDHKRFLYDLRKPITLSYEKKTVSGVDLPCEAAAVLSPDGCYSGPHPTIFTMKDKSTICSRSFCPSSL